MSSEEHREDQTHQRSGGLLELVRVVLIAGLIALGVRTFLFEPFNIPSGSMLPTLYVGDFLFVSKFAYGYSKHTVPWVTPPLDGRFPDGAPQRGDVVVFKLPQDGRTDYIKRVIGMPGDRIAVRDGRLFINGDQVPREPAGTWTPPEDMRTGTLRRYVETLPGGREHYILEESDQVPGFDDTPTFEVPAGHYFMMGDNRDNSLDSRRRRVGFVPEENIVGRAEILWFSLEADTRFWQLWRWPVDIRYGRLFDLVQVMG